MVLSLSLRVGSINRIIDLHPESIEEATYNFKSSPFASRLAAINCNFLDFDESHRFDALISNPPFFD